MPVKPVYTYAQCRQFAGIIAFLCRDERPDLITLEPSLAMRCGRLYLDYMQNVKGKTLASVHSVRARPGAPVSTPLRWSEVRPGLRPADFNIANMPARLKKMGDLFAGVLTEKQDFLQAIERGEALLK